jgi:molybdopterin molybdotransferase
MTAPPTTALAWDQARLAAHAAGAAHLVDPVEVPLAEADGGTLARPLLARTDLPAFATSSIDGWAVRGPGPWRVVGRILAGTTAAPLDRDGTCVEIATGAMVPDGTEQIVRVEESTRTADGRVTGSARPTREWRDPGEEAHAGEELFPAGTPVTPGLIGLAASCGYDTLAVRRPQAAVLVFGDELLTSGLPGAGRVRDSLGPSLPAWLRRLGATTTGGATTSVTTTGGATTSATTTGGATTSVTTTGGGVTSVTTTRGATTGAAMTVATVPGVIGPVEDTLDAHVAAIRSALDGGADLVCTTGGTMHGPVDHLHAALRELGAGYVVNTVEVRPGFPMLLASVGRALVAGLPGNPQSAVVALLSLVAPALAGMCGRPVPALGRIRLRAAVPDRGRYTHLALVDRDGRPVTHVGSSMLRGLAGAAGFAVVPPGSPAAEGGEVALVPLPVLEGERP